MDPHIHLILTAVLFFALTPFIPLTLNILFLSLALTILIDVFDHLPSIAFARTAIHSKTRSLIRQGRLIEAYTYYHDSRMLGNISYLHNFLGFFIIALPAFYFLYWPLIIGVVFHFACDIVNMHSKGFRYRVFPPFIADIKN